MQQFVPTLDQKKVRLLTSSVFCISFLFQTLVDLANLSSHDDCLKYAVDYLDQTLHLGTEYLTLAAHRYRSKLLAAEKYLPSGKIQCATTLFRVQSGNYYGETIPQDYNLSTVSCHIR